MHMNHSEHYVAPDDFKKWPKTPRATGNAITITEKMDGTNAAISIYGGEIHAVQSRNRLITPDDDHYGFAQWCHDNNDELVKLGDGRHYGEWVGYGIQSNPHQLGERRFFIFNTFRPTDSLPDCVSQVEVLYNGAYSDEVINRAFDDLWMAHLDSPYTPEGIIIYNHLSKTRMKMTYKNNDGKWKDNPQ